MNKQKDKNFQSRKSKRLIFYVIGMSLPVLQFCIFYLGVNINSVLLSFKEYQNNGSGQYVFRFVGMDNYAQVVNTFAENPYMVKAIFNSLILFLETSLSIAISLLFSYYIMKKYPFAKVFQIILFLPHIVSAIIMVALYKNFVNEFIPSVFRTLFNVEVEPLLRSDSLLQTQSVILFFCLWISFGTRIMLFSGAMNGISDGVLEASKIDGCSPAREFFSIILPMIYPTFTTLVVVAVSQIFTNQMSLYSFYGTEAERQLYTIGYYLYVQTKKAGTGLDSYPYIAAFGIMVSAIVIPLTVTVRNCMKKFGPSVD